MATQTMTGKRRTTLPEDHCQKVATDLQAELVDLSDLSLQGKQAHWTVVGPHFRGVHLQLDEMVEAYRRFTDEVAERLAAIGVWPDGQVGTVAQRTLFAPLPAGAIQDTEVVQAFADRVAAAASRARDRAARLNDLDAVSHDLFLGIIDELEKQLWMLQAQEQ